MVRLVTGLFTFALVLCALIVLRPHLSEGDGSEVAVTRAAGDTMTAEERAAVAEAMIAYQQSLPQADEMQPAPVTAAAVAGREATPETFGHRPLPLTAADRALGRVEEPAPGPAIRTDDSSLTATTAAVLAGLGLETGAASAPGADPLREMTADALTGIAAITGHAAPAARPRTALEALVVEALAAGQSDAYIDALLNEAALAGEITVPEILVTADGRVDTAVLLSSIVADARAAATGEAPEAPTAVGGEGVEVRIVQTATTNAAFRFYTVNPGDSLGAIAVKFYGDIRWYDLIYQANRDILASPDQIMAGQRLTIPDLPAG